MKPNRTITDGSSGLLLIPISSPDVRHEPSSSVVAVGSNIYKMGGHTPSSSEVSVLDCRFNTWHIDGKIYVAGGCEDLNSVNCVEVFDPKTQTWASVTNPGVETQLPRSELKSFGLGGKYYLFGDKRVVYDPKEASWNPIGLGMDMHPVAMAMGLDMDEAMDMEMDMNGVASAVLYLHWVIGDVLFLWNERELRWYDSKTSSWKKLRGVEDFPDFEGDFKMVDVGGKMVVLWKVFGRHDEHGEERSIRCAEIALERRDGDEMWVNVEWWDVVLTNYESYGLYDADVLSVTV
ncbi:hypothetical protein Bca52824_090622 [Brassica carinata]|uniref:FKB95-like N-terminal Kelch domain-containing protein n=1 Tax=Brassica carinata TaxID=52824 RepID=A0A8X7TFU1_BRACI|nr:hypothetical protein Bca52824_090622 [Brassica carinata]